LYHFRVKARYLFKLRDFLCPPAFDAAVEMNRPKRIFKTDSIASAQIQQKWQCLCKLHRTTARGTMGSLSTSSAVDVRVEQDGVSLVDGSAVSFHRLSYFVNHPRSNRVARLVVFSGVRLSMCLCVSVCVFVCFFVDKITLESINQSIKYNL